MIPLTDIIQVRPFTLRKKLIPIISLCPYMDSKMNQKLGGQIWHYYNLATNEKSEDRKEHFTRITLGLLSRAIYDSGYDKKILINEGIYKYDTNRFGRKWIQDCAIRDFSFYLGLAEELARKILIFAHYKRELLECEPLCGLKEDDDLYEIQEKVALWELEKMCEGLK